MTRLLQKLIALAACLALDAVPLAAGSLPPGLTEEFITSGGLKRSYYLHVPTALAGKAGVPAVFVFHGGQGTGLDAASSSNMAAAGDAAGFISVFPNATSQWNDGRATTATSVDDVAFVRDVIADLARRDGVDPARVFASGVSNGGMFTQRLACDAADAFKAFGVVAAYLPADYQAACHPAHALPITFFNGTTDPIMPWNGGAIATSSGGDLGQGGNVLSHSQTMAFWSQVNACATLTGPSDWPDQYRDGTAVQSEGLSGCTGGVKMDIYIITNGGHTWPGSGAAPSPVTGLTSKEINATNQMVAFFQSYGL